MTTAAEIRAQIQLTEIKDGFLVKEGVRYDMKEGFVVKDGVRYAIAAKFRAQAQIKDGYLVKDEVFYDIVVAPAAPDPGQREEALRGIRWAGIVLVVGLVLEMASTLWTFQKSLAAGAYYNGDLDCSPDGRRQILHKSFLAQEACNYGVSDFGGDYCNITDTPTGQDSFLARCACDGEFTINASSCVWYPDEWKIYTEENEYSGRICCALPMIADDNDGEVDYDWGWDGRGCRPTVPSGTYELSITSLAVSLGSELVEAASGFTYLMSPRRSPKLMKAVAVFEALGVAAVACVIFYLPGFSEEEFFGLERTQRQLVVSLAWASPGMAIFGVVTEWVAEIPDSWGRRRPYFGVLGNALVWLGAATLEVVVAAFQTWRVMLSPGFAVFLNEIAGLVAMEVVAVVSMWIARFLWTRSKEMLSPVLARASFPFALQKNRGVALL